MRIQKLWTTWSEIVFNSPCRVGLLAAETQEQQWFKDYSPLWNFRPRSPLEWYLQFFSNNLQLEYWLRVLVQTVDEKWVYSLILTDLHRGSHAWVSEHLHNSHSIKEGNGLSWLGIRIHSKAIKHYNEIENKSQMVAIYLTRDHPQQFAWRSHLPGLKNGTN